MYSHDVGMLFLNKTILRVEKYPTGESRVTTVKYPIGESQVALYETGKCNEKQQWLCADEKYNAQLDRLFCFPAVRRYSWQIRKNGKISVPWRPESGKILFLARTGHVAFPGKRYSWICRYSRRIRVRIVWFPATSLAILRSDILFVPKWHIRLRPDISTALYLWLSSRVLSCFNFCLNRNQHMILYCYGNWWSENMQPHICNTVICY